MTISHKVTLSLKYMYFFSSNTLKLHYSVSVFMLYICWRLHVILRMQYSVSENKISFFFLLHAYFLPSSFNNTGIRRLNVKKFKMTYFCRQWLIEKS